jgi:hypothetical protein
MPSRPLQAAPQDRLTGDRVSVAAEMLAEFGGAVCPSLSSALERLIDRQATGRAGGVR